MALIHFDGFEDHSTDFPSDMRYGITSSWTIITTYQATGRFSDSKALSFSGSARAGLTYNLPTAKNGVAVGASMQIGTLANPATSSNTSGFMFLDDSGNDVVNVGVQANGSVIAWRGTTPGTNVIATSVAGLVSSGAWFHLGVEITRNGSTGTLNVYVDGVQVIAATGVNTYASDISSVVLSKQVSTTGLFDDFYVCDTAAWLGECRSSPLVLTGDTAQKDFTPSTGSDNYACVDELPLNSTDYVSSATVGDKDRYTVTDLGYTPTAIVGVKVSTVANKDDITTRTLRNNLKSGGTNVNGTTRALSSSYRFIEDVFPNDPNTSTNWTKSGVDAIEVGMEVVA